ncbi:Aldo/keto reductase [Fistulina hepatica ATCC 64428]|uniref:Aldo/keto reductase n=1 Tax=Fistulina hepatica ATCC 64428 TaxID=1128425 RepID=A0A0D7A505_9AGAR|nr:Aldo/keto reductase [Fistulina hepatica ATCC 64428]
MSFGKILKLSTSAAIPQIGLGTWLSKPHEVEHAVEYAVRAGYRHLDLAIVYDNQDEVGAALKKVVPSVAKREDLFMTSKVWNTAHRPEEVEKELDETLKQIGTDYLDLYLIHWPVAFSACNPPGSKKFPANPSKEGEVELDMSVSLVDTWKAMLALPKDKVRAVGVSNFTIEHIDAIYKATGSYPVVNQVEAHPLLPQDDLLEYCKSRGIHVTAYSPLGNNLVGRPKLTEEPTVVSIAEKLGATTAQVLVAWGVYRGYSVIPKSVQPERITSNFKQVQLSKEDYESISAIGKDNHTRFNIPYAYTPRWDINIFGETEEKAATHHVNLGA